MYSKLLHFESFETLWVQKSQISHSERNRFRIHIIFMLILICGFQIGCKCALCIHVCMETDIYMHISGRICFIKRNIETYIFSEYLINIILGSCVLVRRKRLNRLGVCNNVWKRVVLNSNGQHFIYNRRRRLWHSHVVGAGHGMALPLFLYANKCIRNVHNKFDISISIS